MSTANRRSFLRFLGSAALTTAFPGSIQRALAVPARRRTGTIEDLEHVVFLMQENRAFDHYFGTLRGVRGFGDPRPAFLPSGRSVWFQPDGSGVVLPFRPTAPDLGLQFIEDTPHGWVRHARGLERRQVRPVGPQQGPHDDGVSEPRGHTVPLRAGGRVHDL